MGKAVMSARATTLKLFVLVVPYLVSLVGTSIPFSADASSKPSSFASNDMGSVFYIAKSENRNQVHYGIHVDEFCRPEGARPVYVYWREREKGPKVVSGLLDRERRVYGIADQSVQVVANTAGRVKVQLGALPDRSIFIESFREIDNHCKARAVTEIKGERGILRFIYVNVGMLYQVNNITLYAETLSDSRPISEVIKH
jgi:hypothetical protein